MYILHFVYPSFVNERFSCYYLFTIVNHAARNIGAQICVQASVIDSFGDYTHEWDYCIIWKFYGYFLGELSYLFLQWLHQWFAILPAMLKDSKFFTSLLTLIFMFLIFILLIIAILDILVPSAPILLHPRASRVMGPSRIAVYMWGGGCWWAGPGPSWSEVKDISRMLRYWCQLKEIKTELG